MVYARFTPTLTNVTTKAVTQWDYGRKLRIDGLELPTAVRIDFGISGDQTTVSRIGITKDHVTDVVIPDSLLEQSNNLVAYVYVNDTTEGKTVRTINIPVTARAKPEEYDTPESKELFAEAIELINDVAVRAENAETSAKSHADSAKASLEATEQIAKAFPDTATAAVNAVNSAGAAQIQAISKKGVDAVADVEAQKQESIAAVKAEGETQLQTIAEETARIVADREQINSNTRNKAGAIVLDAQGESIVLNDASEYPLQGLKLFGKSTQDGTPNPDAPVDIVSVENPKVKVAKRNLFDVVAFVDNAESNGAQAVIQFVENSLQVSGKSYLENYTKYDFGFEPNARYTIAFDSYWQSATNDSAAFGVSFYYADGTNSSVMVGYTEGNAAYLLTSTSGKTVVAMAVGTWRYSGTCELRNINLVKGVYDAETIPAYEQCNPQIITIPHTLPGIPATSGGNYTDADGQQWICDEVDLKRGVYVKRIGTVTLTGGESWSLNTQATEAGVNAYHFIKNGDLMLHSRGYCTHFKNGGGWSEGLSSTINTFWVANDHVVVFKTDGTQSLADFKNWLRAAHDSGNPVTLYYESKSPVETPLSDAEITAFKALHSNKPNTTILNDAGAFMAVEYVADTKTYIDKKISEILKGGDEA